MSEDPFDKIIDNKAGIIDEGKEGSVKDVFKYYVEDAESSRDDDSYRFRMDIGTGYLFFSGFKETYELFYKLVNNDLLKLVKDDENWQTNSPIRVVMGPETTAFTKEILTSIIKDNISLYSDECSELLIKMIEKDLIEFRVYLERRFHPKIYNFYKYSPMPEDIWAGSANFTGGGLSNNIELCIPMNTNSQRRELVRTWFDELWRKSSQDLDFLEIIEDIKKQDFIYLHPRIFFAKMVKLLEKEYLMEEEKQWTEGILLDFQNLSYYIVMERLQKYGGYILANSVGLGKSYVACQAMRSYISRNPNKKCLVVSPSRIISEWEAYLEEFGIEKSVDLISMGILQKTPYNEREEDENYFDYRDYSERYSLIVADEVHHYRNNSNRRKNLKLIIKTNEKSDSLFLSATPVNLGSEDFFRLINLFYFGQNVQKFETQGLRELYDKTWGKVKNTDDENLKKKTIDKIKEIENELVLKISWRVVQEHFEEDLKKLSGEKVRYKEPETEEVCFTYPERYKTDIFDNIVDFLEGLLYEPAKLWDGQGYQDDKNLTFWYKWQLYKRLESSLYSFYKSILNLKDRFHIYKVALEEKNIENGEVAVETIPEILGSRFKDVMDKDRLEVVVDTYNHLDKDLKERIVTNLNKDLESINDMYMTLSDEFGEIENVPFPNDKKLESLISKIKQNLDQDNPMIIFSEYKDTINYLYSSLKDKFDKIEYIHGGTEKSKDKLITEFQDGEIDIILTTDVLSEGVNIPRADTIINYDLPYNPVLLVQRAGRALRITNPKKLNVYNFKPEESIDKELELYERLDVRLNTILSIVGLDFIIWMMDEKKVEELHEEEMDQYLDNYEEYRDRVANTNPDDLVYASLPKESKTDRTIRRAIKKYNISSKIVEDVSPDSGKPFYTTLKDEEDFFIFGKVGEKSKYINEMKESLEMVEKPNLKRVTKNQKGEIDWLLQKAKREVAKERISRRDLSRKINKIIDGLREARSLLHEKEMKSVIDDIINLLESEIYLPDEVDMIEKYLKELNESPKFVKSFDEMIKEREFWQNLVKLSKKSKLKKDIELKGFIKYTEGD